MGPEELLTEEEALKILKINKAQLENYVREGRLSPLYQESVRKFKRSDLSAIIKDVPVAPVELASPFEDEPPLTKTSREEGSTRVIEPPKESRKIGVNKTTGVKATFEKEAERLLKPIEDIAPATHEEKWITILLSVALVISALSIFTLIYNLKGKNLPFLSIIGSVPIGREESNEIKNKADSTIQAAQQTKRNADILIKETEEFINIKE